MAPLTSPEMKLDNFQYSAATWQRNVFQVTMNTGERYQHFNEPRWLAVQFVRNPSTDLLKVTDLRGCGEESRFKVLAIKLGRNRGVV